MATSDAHKQATIRYASKTYKRVPLDLRHEDYTRLQEAAAATSLSVNGYIKAAIAEKISRDSIQFAAPDEKDLQHLRQNRSRPVRRPRARRQPWKW